MLRNIRVKLGILPGPGVDAEVPVAIETNDKSGASMRMLEFQPTAHDLAHDQTYTDLLYALNTSAENERKIPNSYFQWYIRYLSHRLRSLPPTLLSLISPDTEAQGSSTAAPYQKECILLAAVANLLASQTDLALSEILERLEQLNHLQPNAELRPQALQLIFILVGLLTFFYDPNPQPEDKMLQIQCPNESRARVSRYSTWTSYSQDMSHIDHPLVVVLRRFGGIKGPIPRAMFNDSKYSLDPLTASNLSYFTLTKVADIHIDWVGSVCLHLEFDMQHKVLKLFRFPSLCGLLCHRTSDATFLSGLFDDYFADDMKKEGAVAVPSAQFYREIIQSYRILFGQDRHSWKAFAKKHGSNSPCFQADQGGDPLLPRLCGSEWLKLPIYEDIDASGAKNVYSASADFPYFGERLSKLQDFAVTQSPNNWRTVWWDRRDVTRFWTLWAVMVFGGASIVIGIVQVVLAVAQVAAAYLPAPKGPDL